MPLNASRLSRTRKVKGLKQGELARAAGVTQTHISECESGKEPSVPLLEKLADALDCTTDFLLGRSFHNADDYDAVFRDAISRMAFDVFAARLGVSVDQKNRCGRVVGHRAAPLTADGWQILSEQIDLAIPPTNGDLRIVRGGNA